MKVRERYLVGLGDTDATGAIYYARYLYYFDLSRISLFREAGIDPSIFDSLRAVAAYVEYRSVVRFMDVIEVTSWFCRVGRTSLKMCHEVYVRGEPAARGYVVDVYAPSGKAEEIPQDVRAALEKALDQPDIEPRT